MNGMKHIIAAYSVGLLAVVMSLVSCSKDPTDSSAPEGTVAVNVDLGVDGYMTKSFANDGTHRVNRVVIIPFRKVAENLTNDDSNFQPAYSNGLQINVSQFPVNNAVIYLSEKTTYKVLIIGYNQSDYDYNNRTSPANKFDVGSLTSPTTLANFYLNPKSANIVPEFFVCMGEAFNSSNVSQGATFKPEQGYTVKGTLARVVSGLSVTISNIPVFVKSISLVAENLVKTSKATDASVLQVQTTGDGGNRILGKLTPVNGALEFKTYLLPTFDANKTGFFLDVELGSLTQRYSVLVPDNIGVSSSNKLTLSPNHAINLTGNYSTAINYGFTITYGINLDDPAWDGIQ